jgi:hypothetical protein
MLPSQYNCSGIAVDTLTTERRGRVVSTSLYSGGPGFKSIPGDRLF